MLHHHHNHTKKTTAVVPNNAEAGVTAVVVAVAVPGAMVTRKVPTRRTAVIEGRGVEKEGMETLASYWCL